MLLLFVTAILVLSFALLGPIVGSLSSQLQLEILWRSHLRVCLRSRRPVRRGFCIWLLVDRGHVLGARDDIVITVLRLNVLVREFDVHRGILGSPEDHVDLGLYAVEASSERG